MDYEKKYKDALDWMRSVYSTLTGAIKEDAEHNFPELKENEDERIRKEIIEYLTVTREKDLVGHPERQCWISYLERQKDAIGAARQQGYEEGMEDGASMVESMQKEQKPAEWSEEDEKMRLECIDIISHFPTPGEKTIGPFSDCVDWLKSLRPQPKQKWSGKDWNMLCDICGYISGSGSSSGITKEERTDWLYELPKRFELQPHWKPSEEQMGALNYAYCELFKRGDVGHNILGPFQSLIDTLRKL